MKQKPLAEVSCPHCHLKTRADYRWCLHCSKQIIPNPPPLQKFVFGSVGRRILKEVIH